MTGCWFTRRCHHPQWSHNTIVEWRIKKVLSLFLHGSWLPNSPRWWLWYWVTRHIVAWLRGYSVWSRGYIKSYGHQTQQGSDLLHGMTTQKIGSPLVKSPFHLWYFFYHKIVPLIIHRDTTRLVLLVRKQELPILTFGTKNSSMNKAKFLGDSACKIWSSNFINAVSQKLYWVHSWIICPISKSLCYLTWNSW